MNGRDVAKTSSNVRYPVAIGVNRKAFALSGLSRAAAVIGMHSPNGQYGTSLGVAVLVRFDADELHHLRPFLGFVG